MSIMPIKYDDPLYYSLANKMEREYGLPHGILDAIRTRGERSNANQVSEAGARGPYQFIAPTRRGIQKNYGVDPWSDAESATRGAALLVKENHDRAGNWDDAVAMYHGGLNRRNWGRRTRAYTNRVGSFDQPQGTEDGMPLGPSMYPRQYYQGQADPLAPLPELTSMPEQPKQAVPVPGDPGPSANAPAASQVAAKKRGGILGALESVFMPSPDSLYGAAMNNPNGIWGARATRDAYRTATAKEHTDQAMAEAKLKNLLTKGEYQIAGNNIVHFPADGGDPEIITPPQTPTEAMRLIDKWKEMDDADPSKELIRQFLLKGNAPEVLQSKERVAQTRAGATVGAARIRSQGSSSTKQKAPPARFILDE